MASDEPSPYRDRRVGEFLGGWIAPESELDDELTKILDQPQ